MAVGALCGAALIAAGPRAAAPGTGPGGPPAAFVATRPSDTADTEGPYRVEFRQLAGPEPAGGRIEYSVTGKDGVRMAEGRSVLRRAADGGVWVGDIPGRPVDSTITYHAVFASASGAEIRHPWRTPAVYRFRVVPLRPVSLRLPSPRELERGAAPVRLLIESRAAPSGEAIARVLGREIPVEEVRVPLSVSGRGRSASSSSLYEMAGELPAPGPGGIVDLYFETRLPGGSGVRIPADAPARVHSIKRSLLPVRRIQGGSAFVLDLAAAGGRRWIGLKGGGALLVGPGRRTRRLGPEVGSISDVARFILPDIPTDRVYVGTNSGVIAVETSGASWVAVGPARSTAWEAGPTTKPGTEWMQRAGPGAVSTLDGTVMFQVQPEDAAGEAAGPATLVRALDDMATASALPAAEMPLVGLSSAAFDAVGGCWLFGGFMRQGVGGLRPAAMESCGGPARPVAVRDPEVAGAGASVSRIVALARDPATGSITAAVELLHDGAPERRQGHGVYRLDEETGRLSSMGPDLDLLRAEVTSLASDWRRGRLLVGTIGTGILAVERTTVRRISEEHDLPAEVTALRVDDSTGTILAGTTRGCFELQVDGRRPRPFGPSGDGPALDGALPMDIDRLSGRVLLSSHSEGLVLLAPEGGGWGISAHLRPGRELPEGFFGDARFGPAGGVVVALRTRGVLLLEGERSRLLGPEQGLRGTLPLRLLVRRNGEIWVAQTPMPFGGDAGAALQVIHDGRVERTIEIAGRDLATIARWVEVPPRDSVFAATRAGVVEFRPDGTYERLSSHSASSVALGPRARSIGIVGAGVERWDGGGFVPLLFAVRRPRLPSDRTPVGSPLDLAIDRNGLWFLLYPGGTVAVIHPERGFVGLLDPEDGIPASARQVLAHPASGEVFVGSTRDGLVVLGPMAGPPGARS